MNSKLYNNADHLAVKNDTWWFEDYGNTAIPVRLAEKNDSVVWTIKGKKVVAINIPEPSEMNVIVSDWAVTLFRLHPNWVNLALQLYNDRWNFTDPDPKYLAFIKALELVREWNNGRTI